MCVISQLRGMLFLPAGALRAWVAVWITACVRGGGGYRDSSASTWSWPSHYLRGRARARCRNTRTHTQSYAHRHFHQTTSLSLCSTGHFYHHHHCCCYCCWTTAGYVWGKQPDMKEQGFKRRREI